MRKAFFSYRMASYENNRIQAIKLKRLFASGSENIVEYSP